MVELTVELEAGSIDVDEAVVDALLAAVVPTYEVDWLVVAVGSVSVDCVVVDCGWADDELPEAGATSREFAPNKMAITAMAAMAAIEARIAVLLLIVIVGMFCCEKVLDPI
jgi:hypothetical protein